MYDCREVQSDSLEAPPKPQQEGRPQNQALVQQVGLQQGFEGQKMQALSVRRPGDLPSPPPSPCVPCVVI